MGRMSSSEQLDDSPVAADVRRRRPDAELPWSWPEGARVLLAIAAIAAAIALGTSRRTTTPAAGRHEPPESGLVLDVNTATPEALAVLPHIGPTLARRIAEARAEGPFRSKEDLAARVRGIGPATLARIAPHVRVGADAEATPGLRTETIAIVDARINPGPSPVPSSPARKPPRSRTRKAKGSLVALTAKGDAAPSP